MPERKKEKEKKKTGGEKMKAAEIEKMAEEISSQYSKCCLFLEITGETGLGISYQGLLLAARLAKK